MSDTPKAQILMYMDAIPCVELNVVQELIHERNTLREERDEARAALRFIAEWGGRTLESEYGDIDCNGKWCAEQAKEALK